MADKKTISIIACHERPAAQQAARHKRIMCRPAALNQYTMIKMNIMQPAALGTSSMSSSADMPKRALMIARVTAISDAVYASPASLPPQTLPTIELQQRCPALSVGTTSFLWAPPVQKQCHAAGNPVLHSASMHASMDVIGAFTNKSCNKDVHQST